MAGGLGIQDGLLHQLPCPSLLMLPACHTPRQSQCRTQRRIIEAATMQQRLNKRGTTVSSLNVLFRVRRRCWDRDLLLYTIYTQIGLHALSDLCSKYTWMAADDGT